MSALATEQAGSVAQLAPRVIVAALEASLSVAMSALASPEQAGSVAQLAPRAIEAALEAPLEDEDRMMASLDTLIEGARSPRAATIVRAAIEARWGLAQLIEQGARPASVARPGRLARILWLTSKLTTDADGADACSRAGAHLLAAKVVCGDLSAGDEDAFEAASAVIEAAGERFQPRQRKLEESTRLSNIALYDAGGRTVLLRSVTERQVEHADVGFVTWPAAAVLARMVVDLATCADAAAQRPRIALELGAGTALVGFVAAAVGLADEIFLTDCRPAVLANLRCGAALNAEVLRSAVSVQVLDFSTDSILADLVLAADCVCSDADAFSLAACLSRCVAPAGRALVVLAEAKHRYGVEKFAPACAALGLAVDIEIVEPAASETPLLAAASGWTPGMTFGVYRITWPVS